MSERKFIYAMTSFLVPKNQTTLAAEDQRRGYEEGHTILWETLEDVERYLDDLREGRDDRPFEHRWNYLVVEKVYFGPYSFNEVVGWWRADKQDNGTVGGYDLIPLDACPLPDCESESGFTIES